MGLPASCQQVVASSALIGVAVAIVSTVGNGKNAQTSLELLVVELCIACDGSVIARVTCGVRGERAN